MRRHLRDPTIDDDEAKSSSMYEVDQIYGIITNEDVRLPDTTTEYRYEELDITFVKNNYEDYCSSDIIEEAPTDLKEERPTDVSVGYLKYYPNINKKKMEVIIYARIAV